MFFQFGDEKARKWLTSIVFSFISGLLFTQPIKVSRSDIKAV